VLAACAAPVLLAATAGAVAAGLLQTRGLFAAGALAPRAERLDPAKNLANLFSAAQVTTVLVGLSKALAALAVGATALPGAARALAELPRLPAEALLPVLPRLLAPLLLRLLPLLAMFAAADLLLARARHRRALRMTRAEVEREHREDEGDPRHKAERRRQHRALLEIVPVARATCIVVNPTHVAVALFHDPGGEAAPLVVAKGAGAEASAIRSAARRAGVPIVRDVALARALWRLAGLGEEIPEELYEAAAAVLVHVHGLAQEAPP
jgi:type III secretion protein U